MYPGSHSSIDYNQVLSTKLGGGKQFKTVNEVEIYVQMYM